MWWLNGGGRLASSLWPCSSPDKFSLPFQKLRTCMVLTRPVEWQKRKKHFIKLCLLYNIAFWKILNPLFTLMEKIEKKIDFTTQKLTSNLCGLNLLGSLYTIGSRCIDLASMFMFHPLLILNPTMNRWSIHCMK